VPSLETVEDTPSTRQRDACSRRQSLVCLAARSIGSWAVVLLGPFRSRTGAHQLLLPRRVRARLYQRPLVSFPLSLLNRRMRSRMSGGVGIGSPSIRAAPDYPIILCFS
jgi:hypothetical protein